MSNGFEVAGYACGIEVFDEVAGEFETALADGFVPGDEVVVFGFGGWEEGVAFVPEVGVAFDGCGEAYSSGIDTD